MQKLEDLSPFEWIENSLPPAPKKFEAEVGITVSDYLPPNFQAYCKIFHPIYVDLSVKDKHLAWDEEARRQSTELPHDLPPEIRPVLAEMQSRATLIWGLPDEPFEGKRILWKEVAREYGLHFHPEFSERSLTSSFPTRSWPRYLIGPDEGLLDAESTHQLILLLTPFTGRQECFFYYDNFATRKVETLIYRGALEEVADFVAGNRVVFGTPTYWWPGDRSWCLKTDYDSTFTLVGGSQQLVQTILADRVLEAVEVLPSTRIDGHADQINFERQG